MTPTEFNIFEDQGDAEVYVEGIVGEGKWRKPEATIAAGKRKRKPRPMPEKQAGINWNWLADHDIREELKEET